ncbi:MAG: energy-coupling factor transporter transmembrane component T [Spirochaetaceae bacterium]|jgi:biotin transport system permease protein|nr:energy-coupling factor transporter transmembrane component T [Spirochaetaceae bacterium]
MAEIDLFHYRYGKGILHRLDARIKLLFLILITLVLVKSGYLSLLLLSAFLLFVFLLEYLQSPILSLLFYIKSIRMFLIFLFVISLIKGMTIDGRIITFLPFLSIEGLQSGMIYSWKLFLLLLMGQILISTTDPSDIHGAIYRILYKIPFIPAGIIATMISLTITFIPIIFDQYEEVKNANNSRLGNLTGNPVKKISALILPLLQTTLFRAEEIAMAMESRCYSENPTLPFMKLKKLDIVAFLIIISFILIIFLLNSGS